MTLCRSWPSNKDVYFDLFEGHAPRVSLSNYHFRNYVVVLESKNASFFSFLDCIWVFIVLGFQNSDMYFVIIFTKKKNFARLDSEF